MKAKDFKKIILFMANQWDKTTAQKIFGAHLGNHYWAEWCTAQNRVGEIGIVAADYATMCLFYKMDEDKLQCLIDYIENYYDFEGY